MSQPLNIRQIPFFSRIKDAIREVVRNQNAEKLTPTSYVKSDIV